LDQEPTSLDLLPHLPAPLTAAPAPAAGLPVSVTHFSLNGLAGVQRETLFSDVFSASGLETSTPVFNSSSTTATTFNANNPFINNNINIVNNNNNNANINSNADTASSTGSNLAGGLINGSSSSSGGGQKFATIGRSNPFTSPNRSKNPFLDRLEGNDGPGSGTTGGPSIGAGSPMSTSPATSPEASLDPVSDSGSCSTLNKIVS
jgi:hypothetical protein